MQFFIDHKTKLITTAALAVLVSLISLNASAIKDQLNDWKLLPQPERLTELYFEDHAKLPTTYLPGTPQSFRFTVHNLEYRDTAYTYNVGQFSEDNKQQTLLSDGAFDLKQDGFKTQVVNFTPVYAGNRSQVRVTVTNTLTKQTETVHYWVTSLISTEQYNAQQPEGAL